MGVHQGDSILCRSRTQSQGGRDSQGRRSLRALLGTRPGTHSAGWAGTLQEPSGPKLSPGLSFPARPSSTQAGFHRHPDARRVSGRAPVEQRQGGPEGRVSPAPVVAVEVIQPAALLDKLDGAGAVAPGRVAVQPLVLLTLAALQAALVGALQLPVGVVVDALPRLSLPAPGTCIPAGGQRLLSAPPTPAPSPGPRRPPIGQLRGPVSTSRLLPPATALRPSQEGGDYTSNNTGWRHSQPDCRPDAKKRGSINTSGPWPGGGGAAALHACVWGWGVQPNHPTGMRAESAVLITPIRLR